MYACFFIEKVAFKIEGVVKHPENKWEIEGWVIGDIVVGDTVIYDSTDQNIPERRFKLVALSDREHKQVPFLTGAQPATFTLEGTGEIDPVDEADEQGHYFYPSIPGVEKLSDDLWRVHGEACLVIKIGDELIFGFIEDDLPLDYAIPNVDRTPKLYLTVKELLFNEPVRHSAGRYDGWQRGFMILQGGNMAEVEGDTLHRNWV